MNNKNIYWIIAGIMNLFTFFLHLIGGQIELVDPMMNNVLPLEVSTQLLGAWHMVTIMLLATSIVLLVAGFKNSWTSNLELVKFTTYLNFSFCLPSLLAGIHYGLLVPQWILFLPIAALSLYGIKKHKQILTKTD